MAQLSFDEFRSFHTHRRPRGVVTAGIACAMLATACGAEPGDYGETSSEPGPMPSVESDAPTHFEGTAEDRSDEGPPSTGESATQPMGEHTEASGGISGVVTDAFTEEQIVDARVCADEGYGSDCTRTDELGRYALPRTVGFDGVVLTFVAEGYATSRIHQPLVNGNAWTHARLPSTEAIDRFNGGLSSADALGPGDVLVLIERESSSPDSSVALAAEHVTFDGEPFATRDLTVIHADDDGVGDTALSATTASVVGISLGDSGLVTLAVDPEGPCRFRGGLEATTTVIVQAEAVSLVYLACAEGLRGL